MPLARSSARPLAARATRAIAALALGGTLAVAPAHALGSVQAIGPRNAPGTGNTPGTLNAFGSRHAALASAPSAPASAADAGEGRLARAAGSARAAADARKLAETYAEAVEKKNRAHAARPKGDEDALAAELSAKAVDALEALCTLEDDAPGLADALVRAGEAALDLARGADFEKARARLAALGEGERLGAALVRPRYVLRGIGGVDEAYLASFAAVLDRVLASYDEVFGFGELSKVPGKKLRVRVRRVERITDPPHFAPEPPYHSEIDFPVPPGERFASPTPEGQFLLYGLCHELGHVVAMWGSPTEEEDHHAWAHYTGAVVCGHVAETAGDDEALLALRDARWRSERTLREEVQGRTPGRGSREEVLALLLALHDAVGPRAIGAAIDRLDREDRRRRVNRVRYYTLRELRDGLEEVVSDREARARALDLLD